MSSMSHTLVGFVKLTSTILKETFAHPLKTSIIEIHEKDDAWEVMVKNGMEKPAREITRSEKTQ